MSVDESTVKTRHKKLLSRIREDHTDHGSERHPGVSDEKIRAARQPDRGDYEVVGGNTQGTTGTAGAGGRSDRGTGQAHTTNEHTIEGPDPTGREVGEAELSPSPWELEGELSTQEQVERRRELGRQRSQRYREKQREETSVKESPLRDVEKKDVMFSLKNIFKSDARSEPDKPLLMKEADDETRKKLVDLYIRGSSILDDVLEILVRDHEPVQIWQLSEAEAEMLVDMQLERARKSAAEARVVRKLVAIYDRLFFVMLIGPRVKATMSHIDRHGGVSFR